MRILKTIFVTSAICLCALTSNAQFRGPGPGVKDLLNGVPLTVTAGAVSNITVFGVPTANGYAISPYFVQTNAGTATIQFQQTPVVPNGGSGATVGSAALIGGVAANGTTAVRGNLLILTNQNCVGIQIGVSNAHTASITVSNLYFISQ